jgi:hypothetical protein
VQLLIVLLKKLQTFLVVIKVFITKSAVYLKFKQYEDKLNEEVENSALVKKIKKTKTFKKFEQTKLYKKYA